MDHNEAMFSMLNKLHDLQFRTKCGVDALNATRECMEGGDNDAKHYIDGLFANTMYLYDIADELKNLVETGFAEAMKR